MDAETDFVGALRLGETCEHPAAPPSPPPDAPAEPKRGRRGTPLVSGVKRRRGKFAAGHAKVEGSGGATKPITVSDAQGQLRAVTVRQLKRLIQGRPLEGYGPTGKKIYVSVSKEDQIKGLQIAASKTLPNLSDANIDLKTTTHEDRLQQLATLAADDDDVPEQDRPDPVNGHANGAAATPPARVQPEPPKPKTNRDLWPGMFAADDPEGDAVPE